MPDNFGIVEPFPRNIFATEFTSANVTCVAYDSSGIKIPVKIIFVRRDQFGGQHELTANGRLYFTKRTEGRHDMIANVSTYIYGNTSDFSFPSLEPVSRRSRKVFASGKP